MVAYRYLGSALTNANGVATFDYQGTGAGEIDVLASLDNPITDSSIVSETLSVLDTLLYDTGTDATHNIWTGDTSNLTRGSEYSTLRESASPTPTSINTVMPTGLWVLTMSIKRDGHYTNWNINILNNNVSVFGCATPTNDVWTDITLVYDGSFIYYFENGSTTPTKKTSVMLDDTKNTVLRLQTPQDITYLDFKDLIVLREGMSNISIGSSNPIIQSGDTTTINGSLYESGLIVKNATLDVYKNGTKVGTASTGDTGVASYTYSGTGAGATEFQFRYGSIVSEIYEVIDGTFLDRGTDSDYSAWTSSDFTGSGISRGSEYTTLTPQDNYDAQTKNISETNFIVELDCNLTYTDGTPTNAFLRMLASNNRTYSPTSLGLSSGEWSHIKFVVSNDTITAFVDDVDKGSQSISNPTAFRIVLNNTYLTNMKYKNFVVYPI